MVTDGVPESAGAHAVDDRGLIKAGQRSVVEVSIQDFECLFHLGAAQVKRRSYRPRAVELESRCR